VNRPTYQFENDIASTLPTFPDTLGKVQMLAAVVFFFPTSALHLLWKSCADCVEKWIVRQCPIFVQNQPSFVSASRLIPAFAAFSTTAATNFSFPSV